MSSGSQPKSSWQPPSLAGLQALLPAYEFLALIGRGGMGAVFKATQRSLNRPVAIKILPANLLEDVEANFAPRFRQEALTMAKLTHPGIVGVFESGESGGMLYIVMEFVDGTDVARMIASEGKIAPELATKILTQVCEALRYAHERGVIHRDIKPANLLLTRDGTVKIADFGLAKHHDDALPGLTKTNLTIGTPDFLAPEAWTPGTTLDERADLYAVGVTLYQMLTGKMPRGLWIMPSERFGTDPRFDTIIERALQPEPESRYQSSAELRRDLEKIQTEPGPGGSAGAARLSASTGSPRLRRAALTLSLVAALLTLVLAVLWPRGPGQNLAPFDGTKTNASAAFLPEPAPRAATIIPATASASTNNASLHELARWLVQQGAGVEVLSRNRSFDLKQESDIPEDNFEIISLGLGRTWEVSGEAMQRLSALTTLRNFTSFSPMLSDEDVAFLAGNPKLKYLKLEGSRAFTDDVTKYFRALGQLEHLELSQAAQISGRYFAGAAWLPKLQQFRSLGLQSLEDDALRTLSACARLEFLHVDGSPRITAKGLAAVAEARQIGTLNFPNCVGLTEAGLVEALPLLTQVGQMDLAYTQFGDQGAAAVTTLTNLHTLFLNGTKLTDAGLATLTKMPWLRSLRVHQTGVTPDGLAAFVSALPKCHVERGN